MEGIDNEGTLIVDNSTFDTNDSAQYYFDTGGGISNRRLTVTIVSFTITTRRWVVLQSKMHVPPTSATPSSTGIRRVRQRRLDSCTADRNAIDADPMLTSLEGHGGTTPTFLPLPGSAASARARSRWFPPD